MGKTGPCYHCGVDHTPLWRNGPPEKPVLCNACGSRYRLRGTLENYIPKLLQARLIREGFSGNLENEEEVFSYLNEKKGKETISGKINNKPSSSSKPHIPSKKRSVTSSQHLTPMEKFQRQLVEELERGGLPEEEVLLYNVNPCIPPNEIGLGVLPLKKNDTKKAD